MNTSVAKKASQAVRLLMMVLTAVLIFFFINVMLLVSDIQGTARVVNYAGLVRGTTQRTFAVELVRAVRTAALNRELQSKVYLDEATGLPNKNKCEEILGQERPVSAEAPVALCVFDLNNLHMVNNNFGHEKGDEYIRSFAQQLGSVASETCFVGRDGGDEFIAVLWDADRAAVESCLARVRANVNEYSGAHSDMPISYAVGYALSSDFDEPPTMRELFSQADKNMYIDKNRVKTAEAAGLQREDR